KLADPKLKGQFCSRSGSHPYNLSLFGSYLEHAGPAETEAWLKGLVANQAREPKGGDTDQIKATATGECGVALSNTYYIARMMRSNKPEERTAMEQVGVVFPNQQSWGTHVNVAGGAMARHSKNRAAAVKFLEYLSTDEAQRYFADGNNEYPAVASARVANPALDALGNFKQELIPLSAVGQNTPKVQQMLDRVGYK
ncbi:MAG: iron(III) transport system substrate-binding protein, partial [Pseudomonadota bacterium]|nr:iron(III) transport system substrate-binding protein [Pseudomonadota bacterium]